MVITASSVIATGALVMGRVSPFPITSTEQDTSTEFSCTVFSPHTTEADLVARFGAINVSTAPVYGLDDGPRDGTVLFADRPDLRVEIAWWDSAKQSPAWVAVRGPVNRWRVPTGITIGTDLRRLERANGRPFRLAGFWTELQGVVLSWSGGRLTTAVSNDCTVGVYIQPPYDGTEDLALMRQVRSGREYSSGHPAMQALNPRVVLLRISFARPLRAG